MAQYDGREISTAMCGYGGPRIRIGSQYDFSDIYIEFCYSDDPETKILADISEYVFHDTDNTVYNEGNNIYSVTWNGMDFVYIVNGIGINYLGAVYTGPWVYINHAYNTHDVMVTLSYKDGHTESIPWEQCTFRRNTVLDRAGIHSHTVSYTDLNGREWETQYMVECIAVVNVYASYNGFPILLHDDYDVKDVTVMMVLSNSVQERIPATQCRFGDTSIENTGSNQKTVKYTDIGGIEWTASFSIEGLPCPVKLDAEYVSLDRLLGDIIAKSEVHVALSYDNGAGIKASILGNDEWEWKTLNIISADNKGMLVVSWEHDYGYKKIVLTAGIKVPYLDDSTSALLAWYEGLPVEVGKAYNKEHVAIYICDKGHDNIRLDYMSPGLEISGMLVAHEGDNWFTVTYVYGSYRLETEFPVQGVIPLVFPDIDFRVLYINKADLSETDMTEDFRPYFTLFGIFNLNWTQFLRAVSDIKRYGMYRLDAPKNTGLFDKYASVWHVFCTDSHTLKAEIFKIYDEPEGRSGNNGSEEKDTGKDRTGRSKT